jgi:hypothetical protein
LLLKNQSLELEEITIDVEVECLAFCEKYGPSVREMPQVFSNDQSVAGLAGLHAALMQIGR